jgi:hypothetical protein
MVRCIHKRYIHKATVPDPGGEDPERTEDPYLRELDPVFYVRDRGPVFRK